MVLAPRLVLYRTGMQSEARQARMMCPVVGRGMCVGILFLQRETVMVARYYSTLWSLLFPLSSCAIFSFNEVKIVQLYIREYSCVRCLGHREDPHSLWFGLRYKQMSLAMPIALLLRTQVVLGHIRFPEARG